MTCLLYRTLQIQSASLFPLLEFNPFLASFPMEAPTRFLHSNIVSRRLFLPKTSALALSRRRSGPSALLAHRNTVLCLRPGPNPKSLRFPLSLSAAHLSSSPTPFFQNPQTPTSENALLSWHQAPATVNGAASGALGCKDCVVTVVLLGWLGSNSKHLRRYVELYNGKGIEAVTFMVDVKEMIWFDLGTRVESRVDALSEELVSWVSETEEDGKERRLLFHTFSNTGWFVYGSLLDRWQERQDLLEKIKGCIVDSGAGEPWNPKVWAAGFSAAMLKKSSFSASPGTKSGSGDNNSNGLIIKTKAAELSLLESALLSALENIFSLFLKLPDVERRLGKVVKALSEGQPPCPQLYLYSTADKVVPYESIESFMEGQRMSNGGRRVLSFNFGTSPHVDHLRTFPDIYSSELDKFFKECFVTVKAT